MASQLATNPHTSLKKATEALVVLDDLGWAGQGSIFSDGYSVLITAFCRHKPKYKKKKWRKQQYTITHQSTVYSTERLTISTSELNLVSGRAFFSTLTLNRKYIMAKYCTAAGSAVT